MNVALLGGSFNPPHVGHLLVATYVKASLDVDEVWLLPSYRHPFGKALTAFEHRLAMCERLCGDASGWLRAMPIERDVGKEGWTVDTLEYLVAQYPSHRFLWIIGSDIVADLPRWRDFDRIQSLARVIVIHRAGYPATEAFGPPLIEVSSSEVRLRLESGEPLEGWVPQKVLEYLRTHDLYTGGR